MLKRKESLLNGLLVCSVLLSLVLSAYIWYPGASWRLPGAPAPQLQAQLPPSSGQSPDIYRPERIYVQRTGYQVALLQPSSLEYRQVWGAIQSLLDRFTPAPGPDVNLTADGDQVTVVLPVALDLVEWAHQWGWSTRSNQPVTRVDRLVIRLGTTPDLILMDPSGAVMSIGSLEPDQAAALKELLATIQPGAFQQYRPLTGEPSVPVLSSVVVPDAAEVRSGSLLVRKPSPRWENARYFPDLSVVRQIDEQDARTYTDGKRLLRMTTAGRMEYREAAEPGSAPAMRQAAAVAQSWVNGHGGWILDLMLGWYTREHGVATLGYELRAAGPYPVETAGGFMKIQVTTAEGSSAGRVIQMERLPEFSPTFHERTAAISSPEQALYEAVSAFPELENLGPVREIHLAYLIVYGSEGPEWGLQPAWVLQIGEDRLYVPASLQTRSAPFWAGPGGRA